jgi:beta-galactosidase
MHFSFDGTGAVGITHTITPVGRVRDLPYLPRVGMRIGVVDALDTFSWYGRGPSENYRDRNHGSPIGVYRTSVEEQYVEYRRPQDHGNHTDVRWAELRGDANGLLVVAKGAPIEAAVSTRDAADRAPYPHMLQRNDGWTTLHLSAAVSGVGDTPNSVQPQYAVPADVVVEYSLTLVPL